MHDTVAAIARQSPYERSLGASALRRFFNWLNEMLNSFVNFFKGSSTGRIVTTVIVAIIVVAFIVHLIVSTLAAKNDVVSAGALPSGSRTVDAWREAQRLAAAGHFTDASHALLAALLWTFAQRGEVRLHQSKTAGDYARELARRGSPARGAFQQFRRRYDEVIFGVGVCSADEYTALLRDAEPMLARAGVA